MPAPAAVINPNNKYKSVVGPTWAGGTNTNAIYALGNPLQAAQQKLQDQQNAAAGMGAMPPSNQEMYGARDTPQYNFGSSGKGYGGGEGYGQGYPNYHSQVRIGNPNGVMAPPSPTSQNGGPSGLASFYNMQRAGNGPLDNMNDQAQLQHWSAGTPSSQAFGIRQAFPDAFPYNPAYDPNKFMHQNPNGNAFTPPTVGQPTLNPANGATFNPDSGAWVPSQGGVNQSGLPLPLAGLQNPAPVAPIPYHYTPDQPWVAAGKMAGRYKGGPVGQKPYLVGEKGPEIYASEDGDHEIVGAEGPEIRTFPKDGKIIPNNKVSKYMLNMRASGGSVDGDPNYPTFIPGPRAIGSFPSIRGRAMGQFPMIQARERGGGVSASPVNYGPPPMQYGQQTPISPYAMQYMPQAPVDPAYAAQAQVAQSDPNAPDSPWAMARYIRMGLQSAARQKLTRDAAYQAVAERKAQQAVASGMGFTPQATGGAFSNPVYGSGSVTYSPQGVAPQGTFGPAGQGLPFGQIGGMNVGQPTGSDPMQTTWQQMQEMAQSQGMGVKAKAHPNPLMELLAQKGFNY